MSTGPAGRSGLPSVGNAQALNAKHPLSQKVRPGDSRSTVTGQDREPNRRAGVRAQLDKALQSQATRQREEAAERRRSLREINENASALAPAPKTVKKVVALSLTVGEADPEPEWTAEEKAQIRKMRLLKAAGCNNPVTFVTNNNNFAAGSIYQNHAGTGPLA